MRLAPDISFIAPCFIFFASPQAIVASDGFVHVVSVPTVDSVIARTGAHAGMQAGEGEVEGEGEAAASSGDGARRIQLVPAWTGMLAPGQKGRPVSIEVRATTGRSLAAQPAFPSRHCLPNLPHFLCLSDHHMFRFFSK